MTSHPEIADRYNHDDILGEWRANRQRLSRTDAGKGLNRIAGRLSDGFLGDGPPVSPEVAGRVILWAASAAGGVLAVEPALPAAALVSLLAATADNLLDLAPEASQPEPRQENPA